MEYHCLMCGTVFKTYVKYSKHLSTCNAGLDSIQKQDVSNQPNNIMIDMPVPNESLPTGNSIIPNCFYKDSTSDFYANSTIHPILQFSQLHSAIDASLNDSSADDVVERGKFKSCAPRNIVHVMVEQDPIESDVELGS